jgi:peptidoglycan L-alanyl-D-glutamate endopeptidase CwlK
MINSRKIDDLIPKVMGMAAQHIALCAARGVDLLITSTYRDYEAQHALYAIGRTAPGRIVTNADAGHSFHNFHCAYDVVPIVHGKPLWNVFMPDGTLVPEWNVVVQEGKACGLEWAGDWTSFKEEAHFQFTGGLTLAQLREGQVIV